MITASPSSIQWWLLACLLLCEQAVCFSISTKSSLHPVTAAIQSKLNHLKQSFELSPVLPKTQWALADSSMYNLDLNQSGIPYAYCDWTGSKHTSIAYIYHSESYLGGLHFYLKMANYDPITKKYLSVETLYEFPAETAAVHSVVPVDFDLDGAVDLMVVFSTSPLSYKVNILKQNPATNSVTLIWESRTSTVPKSIVEPVAMDVNFDGYPDIVAETLATDPSSNSTLLTGSPISQRFVWVNQQGQQFIYTPFKDKSLPFLDEAHQLITALSLPKFSIPHSSALVDLNGDCIPDLVFDVVNGLERQLEVWLAQASPTAHHPYAYVKTKPLSLPSNAQYTTFADMNGDQTFDIVSPVCDSFDPDTKTCTSPDTQGVLIILNQQLPLCQESVWESSIFSFSDQSQCVSATDMCVAHDITWVPQDPILLKTLRSNDTELNFVGTDATSIKFEVGDFDLDGYNDLAAIIQLGQSTRHIGVLMNTMGREWIPPRDPPPNLNASSSQTVAFHYNEIPLGGDSQHINSLALIDYDEDSRLDFLAWGVKQTYSVLYGRSSEIVTALVKQTGPNDNYFLKLRGLSGACDQLCFHGSQTWPAYGSLIHGGTFKISGIDLHGSRFARIGSVSSQTTSRSFQLPYVIFGLSYVNNYIDYVYYGVTPIAPRPPPSDPSIKPRVLDAGSETLASRSSTHWISLIPNSFAIANAYPRQTPSKWKLELTVKPSNMFWHIFFATVGCLTAITLIILILEAKERAEDLKEYQGFRREYMAAV